MTATTPPLTAEEIAGVREFAAGNGRWVTCHADALPRLCDAAESAAAKDAENAVLRQRADALHAALVEARDSIESWACYAAEYFRHKHDLAGELARLDAVIAAAQPTVKSPPTLP